MRKEAPAAFAKISIGACDASAACSPPFPAEDQIAKFKLKKWCSPWRDNDERIQPGPPTVKGGVLQAHDGSLHPHTRMAPLTGAPKAR